MGIVYLVIIDKNINCQINNLCYIMQNESKNKILCFENKIDVENYLKGVSKKDYIIKEISFINKNYITSKI